MSAPANDSAKKSSIKDETGLNDFHRISNPLKVAIDKVGINRYRIPLNYVYKDGTIRNHDTEASMYVQCPDGSTGINMSRLCEFLLAESQKQSVGKDFFREVLTRFRRDMRDEESEPWFERAYLKLKFKYALKQVSLKSENWGWQYYDCELEGCQNKEGKTRMYLTVKYEYSSTCPCSLSMAKQYEEDYKAGRTTEGIGIGSAHSQRSGAVCTVEYDIEDSFGIEDLVGLLRKAIPTETQSLVKRLDEQAFAILNGENPIFVEHASRRISKVLNKEPRVLDWVVSVEHWESLHSHNAVAVIRKGIPGGLV
jgi:GTP cyclohydrolase I